MPNSLRCKIKHLHHNGTLTERECDRILKALEQQLCEDCISREEVNVLVDELARAISDERRFLSRGRSTAAILQDILDLPSVTPKYTEEEIDRAQAVEQTYIDKMVELAVEETKRPKGHWIIIDDCELFMAKCSECGEIVDSRMINKYPYCHCGARMIDPQKSEDEE